jgi:hypothetical protein
VTASSTASILKPSAGHSVHVNCDPACVVRMQLACSIAINTHRFVAIRTSNGFSKRSVRPPNRRCANVSSHTELDKYTYGKPQTGAADQGVGLLMVGVDTVWCLLPHARREKQLPHRTPR